VRIPYVIDNQEHKLSDVLNYLLETWPVQASDIATAYFSIRGYEQVRDSLNKLKSFRLLLGSEPTEGGEVGLTPARRLKLELNQEPFSEATLLLVEDLIRFLSEDDVEVRLYHGQQDSEEHSRRRFLHAKCYLLYGGRGQQVAMFDRINPLAAIVGSSNFTGPGLTSNRELNTVHKTILDEDEIDDPEARREVEYLATVSAHSTISDTNRHLIKSEVGARAIIDLAQWFQTQWDLAHDFKQDLIDLLDESKFGAYVYTPYEVYMKALYEYFRDDLGGELPSGTRTAVELAEFQEDAVRKARQILSRYDGVMIADSVGLGKTWIGKRLLEDYAYHMRQKALVICPASLRSMWQNELRSATIAAQVISQEELGQQDFEVHPWVDVDVILIDESHNFRNRNTQRYGNLERLINANGRRGREGMRKKIILLTATPINNTVFDLYNQINLFTGGDRAYFAGTGIGDLHRYFLAARRAPTNGASIELFNLLEEVVIRRSRLFIRQAYENATLGGKSIKWPERRLRTVHYNLEQAYEGIYDDIVSRIEGLHLAHYSLEAFKHDEKARDDFELGREQALVGIFKSRFLKRFESSVAAFRISVRRALEFIKTFETYLDENRLLDSTSFHNATRFLESESDDDSSIPTSRADELDATAEAIAALEDLPQLDISQYNVRALRTALRQDIEALTDIWYQIRDIGPQQDTKLQRLKQLLGDDLYDKKVLIFTYYKDTARYLGEQLAGEAGVDFRQKLGDVNIRRIDGGTSPSDRDRVVQAFAPIASQRDDIAGTEREIDILISTDVLSEGQNLQDAGIMLNYDLHWNPTRMVQRAGRIDRLGSPFDQLWVYNMFPDEGLESLLHLVESLTSKIETINTAGFLDASVLGEEVNPRNFNTLRRIRDEDNAVIEEQESFVELASSEALLRQLQQQMADEQAREWLENLPDGIHSGLYREKARGVFFYFTAPARKGEGRQHFWRYYDVETQQVIDNRYLIANLIQCKQETPPYIPTEGVNIFDIQDAIILDILQSSQEQQAIEAAPKQIDPVQQTIITTLRNHLNSPGVDRREILELVRFLSQPMPNVHVKTLRQSYETYQLERSVETLVSAVAEIRHSVGEIHEVREKSSGSIGRDDLHLICFDYVWS
jgi:superfamily II DNA or RNA helicase